MNATMTRQDTNLPAEPAQSITYLRPAYRVDAEGDVFTIEVQLPGVNRQNVEINLHEDVLTITARRAQRIPDAWKPISREILDGEYRLQVRLNVEIEQDKIQARVETGVLTLRLPKAEALKPRQITIE